MPNMSGFELLSVIRRRFPQIPVIAISGEYNGSMPEVLIADAFFAKAHYRPDELFGKIAQLLEQSPVRSSIVKAEHAPVWVPQSEAGYFVVTCTHCLRSFSVPDEPAQNQVRQADCVFCQCKVSYLADIRISAKKRSSRAS